MKNEITLVIDIQFRENIYHTGIGYSILLWREKIQVRQKTWLKLMFEIDMIRINSRYFAKYLGESAGQLDTILS